jgi:hypothetical protein
MKAQDTRVGGRFVQQQRSTGSRIDSAKSSVDRRPPLRTNTEREFMREIVGKHQSQMP